MAGYSLKQIRQSHTQKKEYDRQFPLSYFVVRPASFYSSYLILKITDSPSRVAYLGLLIGLTGCAFLVLLPEFTVWPGLLLLLVFILLDASDGNIARVTGNVTYYGRFLDGVVGGLVDGLFWFGLGLGLYRTSEGSPVLEYLGCESDCAGVFFLIAGASITLARLYGDQVAGSYYMHSLEHTNRKNLQTTLTEPIRTSKYRSWWSYLLFLNVGSFDLQLLVLLLCSILMRLDLFLIFYTVFYLGRWIFLTIFYLYRAQRTLS